MTDQELLYRRNREASDAALRRCAAIRGVLQRQGATDRVAFLNVAQFAVLFNADLSALLHQISQAGYEWDRRLTARFLALTLLEALEDLAQLIGKRFQAIIAEQPNVGDSTGRLRKVMLGIREFRRDHEGYLREVRNTIAGHRDHDASVQLRNLESLDVGRIVDLGWRFLEWDNRLFDVLNELIDTFTPRHPERSA